MSNDIIRKQVEVYLPNFLEHGDTPQGTLQNNVLTQNERFKRLMQPLLEFKDNNFSICDVGSGLCDLHGYLLEQGVDHSYTGIEIVPEMVDLSKSKYPGIEVLNVDLLSDEFSQKFDFVVLSGMFNMPGEVADNEWESFLYGIVEKMFDSAVVGISFNALTNYSTFTDEKLFYLSPEEMYGFAQKKLSRFINVSSHYPLYEVNYSVFKKEYMKEYFSHSDFEKYFK